MGPELGPLESLLLAPEAGDWFLEEANVASSRTGHSDRHVTPTQTLLYTYTHAPSDTHTI